MEIFNIWMYDNPSASWATRDITQLLIGIPIDDDFFYSADTWKAQQAGSDTWLGQQAGSSTYKFQQQASDTWVKQT